MNCGMAGVIFWMALAALLFFGMANLKPLIICGLIMLFTGNFWFSNSCKAASDSGGTEDHCAIVRCR
jgi:hypothetical protein